jgi:predicted ATPase with chaperone activity
LLDQIVAKNEISARGFVRLLRVARTLADIENSAMISEQSLAVAMNWRYRPIARHL